MTDTFRQLLTGLRALLVLTVLLGIAYPVAVWGVSQVAFHSHANGSLIHRDGTVVGSTLLGQNFTGNQWFLPRPSAGDYDAQASGGTNAGPSDEDLITAINKRRAAIAKSDAVAPADVPADALTASASGLDPYISPEYAHIQTARAAKARGLDVGRVAELVRANTSGRILGFLGEPRVNVLTLNLALDASG
jgi:K+-transporting ATPase ATPase C chain